MDKRKQIGEYFILESESLGKGAYGKVYKGFHENDLSTPLAIKQINLQMIPESYLEDFKLMVEKEINSLHILEHQNILKLFGVKMTKNNLYLVTELCPDGDFGKLAGKIPIKTFLTYFKQIIKGLIFAKENNVIHRDIKPENILLKDKLVKIADFGFSKFVDDPNIRHKMTTKIGTPLYMAPEVFADDEYSSKCDVWSCGVMLYQMIFGYTPWTGYNPQDLFKSIKNDPLKFPEKKDVDEKLKDLIRKMLAFDQDERLDLEGVLQHEIMKRADSKILDEEFKKKEKIESNNEETKSDISAKKHKSKDDNVNHMKSDINVKKHKSKVVNVDPPKYFIYLENKTEFFNDLANKVIEFKNLLGFTKDSIRQLVILFQKIAVISANKIMKMISMKKKEISEIKVISMEYLEAGDIKSQKPKYEAFLKTQQASFHQTIEDYEKYIKKFPSNFIENVINEEALEMTQGFLREYKRVFDEVIAKISEKLEEFEEIDGENVEFFKTLFMLIKVKKGAKLDEEFEFNEEIDAFEEFRKDINEKLKGKKAKEKTMKKLKSVIG